MQKISDFFYRHALILPLFVFCLSSLGRGVTNTLLLLYATWGLVAFRKQVVTDNPKVVALWIFMILAFLLSSIYNGAFEVAQKQWIVFALSSLILILTLMADDHYTRFVDDRLLKWFLLIPVLIFLVSAVDCALDTTCKAAFSVSSMKVPVIAPLFAVVFFQLFKDKWLGYFLVAMLCLLGLLVLADSRTELLMLMVAVTVMVVFQLKRMKLLALIPVMFIALLLLFPLVMKRNALDLEGNYYEILNRLSAERIDIWSHAISNPPDNMLLGSGVNNTLAYLPDHAHKSAFHNAYLEIWYETGFLGLSLWLLLFIVLLKSLPRVYLESEGSHRIVYTAFLGSFIAVLVAGMFDKGYMSSLFEYFIFYLGAVLYLLGLGKNFAVFKIK